MDGLKTQSGPRADWESPLSPHFMTQKLVFKYAVLRNRNGFSASGEIF